MGPTVLIASQQSLAQSFCVAPSQIPPSGVFKDFEGIALRLHGPRLSEDFHHLSILVHPHAKILMWIINGFIWE